MRDAVPVESLDSRARVELDLRLLAFELGAGALGVLHVDMEKVDANDLAGELERLSAAAGAPVRAVGQPVDRLVQRMAARRSCTLGTRYASGSSRKFARARICGSPPPGGGEGGR